MFDGKVVLITGASSGIGAATAVKFAELGADVVITGRNVDKLKKTAQQCEAVSNIKPLVVAGDLCNEEFVRSLVSATTGRFKKLDVLVNNAGCGEFSTIETVTLQKFDEMFNLNVRAVFYLTMMAVPYLIETKGNIVNISSVASFVAIPNFLPYSMAKSAIDQFSRCCSLDLASKGVRVNCVNPGVVITDFFKNSKLQVEGDPTEFMEDICKSTTPLGRAGRPNEIAEAIVYLASSKASFTTGANHVVDGGYHVTSHPH